MKVQGMDFFQAANASRGGTQRLKTLLSRLSPSDRVAGALILAGALLAAMCLTTEVAHSAGF